MALSNETSAQLEAKVKASLRAGTPLPKSVAFDEIRIPFSEGSITIEFLLEGNVVSTHALERMAIGDQINLRGLTGTIPVNVELTL